MMLEDNHATTDSIRVLSTPDLYNLSLKWASEYNKLFPEAKIKVRSVSDEKTADDLMSLGYLGFL